jgi:hypothetical protein
MGWDNPPLPWQELERRLSRRTPSSRSNSDGGGTQGNDDRGNSARRRARDNDDPGNSDCSSTRDNDGMRRAEAGPVLVNLTA